MTLLKPAFFLCILVFSVASHAQDSKKQQTEPPAPHAALDEECRALLADVHKVKDDIRDIVQAVSQEVDLNNERAMTAIVRRSFDAEGEVFTTLSRSGILPKAIILVLNVHSHIESRGDIETYLSNFHRLPDVAARELIENIVVNTIQELGDPINAYNLVDAKKAAHEKNLSDYEFFDLHDKFDAWVRTDFEELREMIEAFLTWPSENGVKSVASYYPSKKKMVATWPLRASNIWQPFPLDRDRDIVRALMPRSHLLDVYSALTRPKFTLFPNQISDLLKKANIRVIEWQIRKNFSLLSADDIDQILLSHKESLKEDLVRALLARRHSIWRYFSLSVETQNLSSAVAEMKKRESLLLLSNSQVPAGAKDAELQSFFEKLSIFTDKVFNAHYTLEGSLTETKQKYRNAVRQYLDLIASFFTEYGDVLSTQQYERALAKFLHYHEYFHTPHNDAAALVLQLYASYRNRHAVSRETRMLLRTVLRISRQNIEQHSMPIDALIDSETAFLSDASLELEQALVTNQNPYTQRINEATTRIKEIEAELRGIAAQLALPL